jgi:uncharacterized protein (UPF0332 family)
MNKIKFYIKKHQIVKDKTAISKSGSYLKKARHNLEILDALDKLNHNEKVKGLLKLSKEFDSSEWVVICGYYAMYTSALALVAKIGFRSKNHTATFAILEEYFVKKKILDEKIYLTLKNATFQKEELEKLSEAKHQREIAQYSITKQTTKDIAKKIKKDAYSFVNHVEEILF